MENIKVDDVMSELQAFLLKFAQSF